MSTAEIYPSIEEATNEFSGCLIRADCGTSGVFQGRVVEVNPVDRSITIEDPYKNDNRLPKSRHTIPSAILLDIQVISFASSPNCKDALQKGLKQSTSVNKSKDQRQQSVAHHTKLSVPGGTNTKADNKSSCSTSMRSTTAATSGVNNRNATNILKGKQIHPLIVTNKKILSNKTIAASALVKTSPSKESKNINISEKTELKDASKLITPTNVARTLRNIPISAKPITISNEAASEKLANKSPEIKNLLQRLFDKVSNSDYSGGLITIDCGVHGAYQGRISSVDLENSSISLKTPFKNGRPMKNPIETLSKELIQHTHQFRVFKPPATKSLANIHQNLDKSSHTHQSKSISINNTMKSTINSNGANNKPEGQNQTTSNTIGGFGRRRKIILNSLVPSSVSVSQILNTESHRSPKQELTKPLAEANANTSHSSKSTKNMMDKISNSSTTLVSGFGKLIKSPGIIDLSIPQSASHELTVSSSSKSDATLQSTSTVNDRSRCKDKQTSKGKKTTNLNRKKKENKRLKVDKIADGDESSVGLKGAFITETDALKSITNRIINAEENEAKIPEKKQGSNQLQALNKAKVRIRVSDLLKRKSLSVDNVSGMEPSEKTPKSPIPQVTIF